MHGSSPKQKEKHSFGLVAENQCRKPTGSVKLICENESKEDSAVGLPTSHNVNTEKYKNMTSILDTLEKMKDSHCKLLKHLTSSTVKVAKEPDHVPASQNATSAKNPKRRLQKKVLELPQHIHAAGCESQHRQNRRQGPSKLGQKSVPVGSASVAAFAARKQSCSVSRLLQPEFISTAGMPSEFEGGELRLGQPARLQLVENLLQLDALVTASGVTECGVISNDCQTDLQEGNITDKSYDSSVNDFFGSRPSTEDSYVSSPTVSSIAYEADRCNETSEAEIDDCEPYCLSPKQDCGGGEASLLLPHPLVEQGMDRGSAGENTSEIPSQSDQSALSMVESGPSDRSTFGPSHSTSSSSSSVKQEVSFQQPVTSQSRPGRCCKRAYSAGPYHRFTPSLLSTVDHHHPGAVGGGKGASSKVVVKRKRRKNPEGNGSVKGGRRGGGTGIASSKLPVSKSASGSGPSGSQQQQQQQQNAAVMRKKKRRARSAKTRGRRVELKLTEEQIESMPLWVVRHIIANLRDIRPEHYSLLLRLSEDDVRKHNATEEQMTSLTTVLASDEHERESCVICMEAYVEGQSLTLLPLCRHSFHTECVVEYFEKYNSACPLCKTKLLENPREAQVPAPEET